MLAVALMLVQIRISKSNCHILELCVLHEVSLAQFDVPSRAPIFNDNAIIYTFRISFVDVEIVSDVEHSRWVLILRHLRNLLVNINETLDGTGVLDSRDTC